jgi:hypothetical protein
MAEFKKEIERLTERIAAERRRVRSRGQTLASKLQRGELGNALNVLAGPVSQYAPRQGRGSARGLRIR